MPTKNEDQDVTTNVDPNVAAVDSVDTAKVAAEGDVDRVQMVSRKPDGSPDQTPRFERVVDTETAVALDKAQLGEQAASNVDHAVRRQAIQAETVQGELDPATQRLKDAQEAAIAAAEDRAESENK